MQVSTPADLDTATWLSRVLGNATVQYETASAGSSRPAGLGALSGGTASVSEGTSTHLTGHPLLTPDEAMRLSPDLQVFLLPGKAPALARKLRHYADPEFAGLADG